MLGLLSNKNIRIKIKQKNLGTPYPRTMTLLGGQGGYFRKFSRDSKTSDMTSDGLAEMFEGDSADTCAENFCSCRLGDERTVKQSVSEDPHRRERIFYISANDFVQKRLTKVIIVQIWNFENEISGRILIFSIINYK